MEKQAFDTHNTVKVKMLGRQSSRAVLSSFVFMRSQWLSFVPWRRTMCPQ